MAGELPLDYLEMVRDYLLHPRPTPMPDGRSKPSAGLRLEPGLTDAEFQRLEDDLGLRFPPDLRSFLQFMLPVHPDFPDWRNDAENEIEEDQRWLFSGIWGDIDGYDYFAMNDRQEWELVPWQCQTRQPSWGSAPRERNAAYAAVRERFLRAPRLIRIFVHRFIPDTPAESGNPVFSVMQTDIIHYGFDLADYLHNEFGVPRPAWAADEPRSIPFWEGIAFEEGFIRNW